MSALDRITDKHTKNMTKLEFAIFMLWNSFSEDGIAGQAAEELDAKDTKSPPSPPACKRRKL